MEQFWAPAPSAIVSWAITAKLSLDFYKAKWYLNKRCSYLCYSFSLIRSRLPTKHKSQLSKIKADACTHLYCHFALYSFLQVPNQGIEHLRLITFHLLLVPGQCNRHSASMKPTDNPRSGAAAPLYSKKQMLTSMPFVYTYIFQTTYSLPIATLPLQCEQDLWFTPGPANSQVRLVSSLFVQQMSCAILQLEQW